MLKTFKLQKYNFNETSIEIFKSIVKISDVWHNFMKVLPLIFKVFFYEISSPSFFLINPETSLVPIASGSWHYIAKLHSRQRKRFNSVFRNNGPRDRLFTMPAPRGVITRDRLQHARVRQFKLYFVASATHKKEFLEQNYIKSFVREHICIECITWKLNSSNFFRLHWKSLISKIIIIWFIIYLVIFFHCVFLVIFKD